MLYSIYELHNCNIYLRGIIFKFFTNVIKPKFHFCRYSFTNASIKQTLTMYTLSSLWTKFSTNIPQTETIKEYYNEYFRYHMPITDTVKYDSDPIMVLPLFLLGNQCEKTATQPAKPSPNVIFTKPGSSRSSFPII